MNVEQLQATQSCCCAPHLAELDDDHARVLVVLLLLLLLGVDAVELHLRAPEGGESRAGQWWLLGKVDHRIQEYSAGVVCLRENLSCFIFDSSQVLASDRTNSS